MVGDVGDGESSKKVFAQPMLDLRYHIENFNHSALSARNETIRACNVTLPSLNV